MLDRFLRRARRPARVDVGLFGEVRTDGETQASIAAAHEFGLGVPQRSFLRSWFDANLTDIRQEYEWQRDRTRQLLRRRRLTLKEWRQVLGRLGAWAVGEIQEEIHAGIDPPNADSTEELKGSSTPLIDTGQLVSGITSRVKL